MMLRMPGTHNAEATKRSYFGIKWRGHQHSYLAIMFANLKGLFFRHAKCSLLRTKNILTVWAYFDHILHIARALELYCTQNFRTEGNDWILVKCSKLANDAIVPFSANASTTQQQKPKYNCDIVIKCHDPEIRILTGLQKLLFTDDFHWFLKAAKNLKLC